MEVYAPSMVWQSDITYISVGDKFYYAVFIIDVLKEHIAVKEAQKLNIPIFAMVDTNCDPNVIDYVIPSNDDASKSIDKVLSYLTDAVAEGLAERKSSKEKEVQAKENVKPKAKEVVVEEAKVEATKVEATKVEGTKVETAKVETAKVEAAKVEAAPKAKAEVTSKEEK